MARDNNQDKDASAAPRHTDSETNPFVAFRRFADEQVSSMLQSVTGLPSTISSPHSDRWEIFNDDYGYKNMTSRQRSSENSSEEPASERGANASSAKEQDDSSHRNPNNAPSHSSQSQLPENHDRWPSQSWKKLRSGSADFFGLDSFFDRFWLEDRFFPLSHFFHPHRNFSIPDMFEDTDSPTWPIAYIMFSPYSPLYLERQAQYHKHREEGVFTSLVSTLRLDSDRDPAEPQWREAFEDLLRLENGKQMLERDASALSKTESGSDWVQGLVKRGSLGDRWKYVSGTENQPWSGITFTGPSREKKELEDSNENGQRDTKSEEEAETELDLYNRFLRDIEAREREFFQGGESPLLRFLLEERRRQQEELDQYRRSLPRVEDEQGNDDTESWLDLVSGGSRKSVPETVNETDSTTNATATDSSALQPHVVSTMVRTERVRLADGSIQTKTVKTKRFANGREENDTSVEVTHAPRSQTKESESESMESGRSKSGWFWKDE
ncbi:uncharacterized protein PFLUO_LOCUS5543 [Penicillium psychrofluorescens]|uniref:uncharacterized protein n=1 Tax=Penicillium psychrofluorescens TaxID=3158075 RepID=UPI003CCD4F02